jgi:hypothetical protein
MYHNNRHNYTPYTAYTHYNTYDAYTSHHYYVGGAFSVMGIVDIFMGSFLGRYVINPALIVSFDHINIQRMCLLYHISTSSWAPSWADSSSRASFKVLEGIGHPIR